jgi:hypothetical protein
VINGEVEPGAGPGAWLSVNAAAKRLGLTPKGVRNRIDRGAILWRPAGNRCREVLVTPGMEAGDTEGGAVPGQWRCWCRWPGWKSAWRPPSGGRRTSGPRANA